ncbi:PulJ/GspJ family protein [Cyanobacterium sp. IPPAS B-1200]|uniref:PulJ/GspJ family protein n=1 Tax=Cyanobacterium sp. IPPAS B-1200 TaxID=1562720 RepID=UPI0008524C44|nr:prepilin-type N-terminal cleavage/methylation domain-containing protein [Cyanobacterium sp. IPPAS B-1200]OEJ78954.1 hypothetical protein A5482_11695 [Cyanobacterium sp. IPPAS B-1200]
MKNHKLLFKLLQQPNNQGITLTELLVALVISGIVLTATTSGFINILRANQNVNSKSDQLTSLSRTLVYIQEDIKQAISVEAVTETDDSKCDSTDVDSVNCLKLTYPTADNDDGSGGVIPSCDVPDAIIYYGYQDISSSDSIWFKPGILRRKTFTKVRDDKNTSDRSDDTCSVAESNWITVADGLISVKENDPTSDFPAPNGTIASDDFCSQNDTNWTGSDAIYGADSSGFGGFRFCLEENDPKNRLVRIFLYGNIINGDPIQVDVITFARAGQN